MNRRTYAPRKPSAAAKDAAVAFQSGGVMPSDLTPQDQAAWLASPEGQAFLTQDSLRAIKDAGSYDGTEDYQAGVAREAFAQVDLTPMREDQRVVKDPIAFMKAGNATFTVVSRTTGKRFTYRVRAAKEGTPHFVQVLTGPDNTSSYTYLGTIFADGTFRHTRKSAISESAPSAQAFNWFYRNPGSDKVKVYHEGRCCRCGRKLTVPSSVESGIGPECAGKM